MRWFPETAGSAAYGWFGAAEPPPGGGARRRDILMQLLIESTTLSIIGAAVGVLAGVGVAIATAWLAGRR
ncbi:MAG TPA: ABC transporter permease [Azospirillum sp.]|nr:ABC transporter permease [Azospirillum sp.]